MTVKLSELVSRGDSLMEALYLADITPFERLEIMEKLVQKVFGKLPFAKWRLALVRWDLQVSREVVARTLEEIGA